MATTATAIPNRQETGMGAVFNGEFCFEESDWMTSVMGFDC